MAHANPYTPGQVETLEQAQNELVKLADVVNQIIANQKMVQRDDGCLADCAVVPHTLSDEVVRMVGNFELLGAYAARPYQKGQVVTYNDRMYVCALPHQGGAVMDMGAWRLIGKAGCGCDGGDVFNPCAPKKTYSGVLGSNFMVDSANGCLQFFSTTRDVANIVIEESRYQVSFIFALNVNMQDGEVLDLVLQLPNWNMKYDGNKALNVLVYRMEVEGGVLAGSFTQMGTDVLYIEKPLTMYLKAMKINGVIYYISSYFGIYSNG